MATGLVLLMLLAKGATADLQAEPPGKQACTCEKLVIVSPKTGKPIIELGANAAGGTIALFRHDGTISLTIRDHGTGPVIHMFADPIGPPVVTVTANPEHGGLVEVADKDGKTVWQARRINDGP